MTARSREARVARTVEREGVGKSVEMSGARAGWVLSNREKTSSKAGLSSEAGREGR